MGFLVKTRLATRQVAGDVPVGVVFRNAKNLAAAVLDLYRGGAPLWHLGFLNAAMARAKGLEERQVLFGAYPEERASWVEPAFRRASETHRGRSWCALPAAPGCPGSGREGFPAGALPDRISRS
jgi:hypothetical protein